MKRLYPTLPLLLTGILLSSAIMASNPKKVKLRKYLPKKAVATMMELVVGGYGEFSNRKRKKDHFNPYGKFMIGMQVFTNENKVYGTPGIGGGIFSWKNFDVEVVGGSFKHSALNRSKVTIFEPDHVPDHKVRIRVSSRLVPDLVAEMAVPLDFGYSYQLAANGSRGPDGPEECRVAPAGADGRDHRKCDGEDGREGRRGIPGGMGFDGAQGPDIEVYLYPYTDLNSGQTIIEAHERNLRTGQVRKRWYDPRTASLTVLSRGGKGGDGGNGQRGGAGGDGGDGGFKGDEKHKPILALGGRGGDGGRGGHGGDGGIGGPGGQITVIFHKDLMPYLGSVSARSIGGNGGCAGEGGKGGAAGNGGEGTKADGPNGRMGGCGSKGIAGPRGMDGPPVAWVPMARNT